MMKLIKTIRFILIFSLVALINGCVKQSTGEQIVSNCIKAMGGKTKIESLKTIKLYRKEPSEFLVEIKRPNYIRKEAKYILVFDGRQAAWLKRPPAKDGAIQLPMITSPEEWKDFEIDIAIQIPAFWDYPAKYVGDEVIDGEKYNKLSVTLPCGSEMVYSINTNNYLVSKLYFDFTYDGKVSHNEVTYSDYREVENILYPYTTRFKGQLPRTFEKVDINLPLDDNYFTIPDSIK